MPRVRGPMVLSQVLASTQEYRKEVYEQMKSIEELAYECHCLDDHDCDEQAKLESLPTTNADLLAALEGLRLWVLSDHDINEVNGLMDAARAAIKAAKGDK